VFSVPVDAVNVSVFLIFITAYLPHYSTKSSSERRGRRRKQILNDRKETRGYWKLKEEELDSSLWRTCFGRSYGPVVRHTTD
jgi:hypothetical protein